MTAPAPFEALDAYVTGDMSDADAAGFEEELFEAAARGNATDAAFVDQVSRLGRFIDGHGGFDVGGSRARVDELLAKGLRVQLLAAEPQSPDDHVIRFPKIEDDAELVVTHLPLDVRGYDSVDVVIEKPNGEVLKRFRDIGFDPHDGSVYAVCEAPLARISAAVGLVRATVIGKRDEREQVIASFESITG